MDGLLLEMLNVNAENEVMIHLRYFLTIGCKSWPWRFQIFRDCIKLKLHILECDLFKS